MGDLAEPFRSRRQRSKLVQITLDQTHLENYPAPAHLEAIPFTVRLIRTHGSRRQRSKDMRLLSISYGQIAP